LKNLVYWFIDRQIY